jgi:hypothetical protein
MRDKRRTSTPPGSEPSPTPECQGRTSQAVPAVASGSTRTATTRSTPRGPAVAGAAWGPRSGNPGRRLDQALLTLASAPVARWRLTIDGFLVRFAFALLVVGATYNPTRYSYYAWAERTGWQWRPLIVFAGVVLLIGWASACGSPCAPSAASACSWPTRSLPPSSGCSPTGAGCSSRTSPPFRGSAW